MEKGNENEIYYYFLESSCPIGTRFRDIWGEKCELVLLY